MKTLPIKELLKLLNYTDLRSVRRWCHRNNVFITKQGLNECVYEVNFYEVFDKPFIDKLKSKFGEEWQNIYLLYKNQDIPALSTLNDLVSNPCIAVYKSKSTLEKKYRLKFSQHAKTQAA